MTTRLRKPLNHYAVFETAIGPCALAWNERGVAAVQLPEKNARETVKKLAERFADKPVETQPPAAVARLIESIKVNLSGNRAAVPSIELDLDGVPPFHRKVYEATRRIPSGTVASYGEVARAAGSPNAARAVGQAMARNPFPLVVPCHRVMGHDGSFVGFSASGGCTTKERLLTIEGYFNGGGVAPALQSKSAAATRGGGKKIASAGRKSAAVSRREKKHLKLDESSADVGMKFLPGAQTKCELEFDPDEALQYLARADKRLGKLIERVGGFRLELDVMLTPFEALAESIVYQQLTGKAAATIFSRVKGIYGGGRLPHPKKILDTPDELLRAAGLSGSKAAALKDLAARHHAGLIPDVEQLRRMTDEQIIESLTSVRGIGRWTVEMLLIFRLGRADVLPINDYGVRKGFAATYKLADLPTPKELGAYGERWKPFRSVAAWYMWRALEL